MHKIFFTEKDGSPKSIIVNIVTKTDSSPTPKLHWKK